MRGGLFERGFDVDTVTIGERGGAGASVLELGQAVAALAEHCASSGLVLAMHGIQVACLVRHAAPATLTGQA